MSNDVVIRVENLSKLYRIGARQQGYKTLRESIMGTLTAPLQRFRRNPATRTQDPGSNIISGQRSAVNGQRSDDTIWALKDVSFEVKAGEVVALLGV